MKLIDSSEVCEMLGISKSTLYRWCGIKESTDLDVLGIRSIASGSSLGSMRGSLPSGDTVRDLMDSLEQKGSFPRPFKIGRALKWDADEIMKWLEMQRC